MDRSWTHWNRLGVFKIKQTYVARSAIYELYFEGRLLGLYLEPTSASEDVTAGLYDSQLGFKGSEIGLPPDPSKWNNL
jgi:hypothetical protein